VPAYVATGGGDVTSNVLSPLQKQMKELGEQLQAQQNQFKMDIDSRIRGMQSQMQANINTINTDRGPNKRVHFAVNNEDEGNESDMDDYQPRNKYGRPIHAGNGGNGNRGFRNDGNRFKGKRGNWTKRTVEMYGTGRRDRFCSFCDEANPSRPSSTHNSSDCWYHPDKRLAKANRDRMASFGIRVPSYLNGNSDQPKLTPAPSSPTLDMNDPKVRDFVHHHALQKVADMQRTFQMTNLLRDRPTSPAQKPKDPNDG